MGEVGPGTWDEELCLAREGNCMRWMESGGLLEVEGDVVIWWVEPCLFRRFLGLIEAVPASQREMVKVEYLLR